MDRPKAQVTIRNWGGLITKMDRRDLPPGAGQIQVNAQSRTSGQLQIRRGLRPVRFA
jgi:hypothetical protein